MRSQWKIPMVASEVVAIAHARVEHEDERISFWSAEKQRAEDAVREAGLKVRSYDVTGGQRHDVVVDPALAARLGECQQKLDGHVSAKAELEQWARALEGRNIVLDMDRDDLRFFGA